MTFTQLKDGRSLK